MNHKYALGLLLTMSVMSPVSAIRAAEPQNILISEIAWAGSEKSTADEWIELKNLGSGNIDISGWSLTGVGTSGSAIAIPSGTSISAGSTYLIANYAITDSKTTLVITPNLVTTAVSIPNTGLNILLLDSSGGIIDSLVDPGTPNCGSSTTFSTMKRDLTSKGWFTESTSTNVSHISTAPDPISSTSSDSTTTTSSIITDPVPIADSSSSIDSALAPATSTTIITDTTPPADSVSSTPSTSLEQSITEITSINADPSPNITTEAIIDSPVSIDPVAIEVPIVDTSSINSTPDVIVSEISPIVEPIAAASIETSSTTINPIITAQVETTSAATPQTTTSSSIVPVAVQTSTAATTTPIATPIPTSAEIQSPATSSVIVGNIVINEILPSPSTGNDEWIELRNMTNASLLLNGLTLIDASGKVTDLAGSISANGYAVIANPNGNLNNDAETVTLMNGSTILNSVSYGTDVNPAPKKDFALALVNGAWISQQSTPAVSNVTIASPSITTTATSSTSAQSTIPIAPSTPIIPTISPTLYANSTTLVAAEQATNTASSNESAGSTGTQSSHASHVATAKSTASTTHPIALATTSVRTAAPISSTTPKTTKTKTATKKKATSTKFSVRRVTLDDISSIADGTQVQLEGIVVATAGVLGKRSFFIDGLEIYQGTGTLADVNVGDRVSITGEVSVLSDHRRINIKEGGITIADHTNPIIHDYESRLPYGSLVRITGIVSARDGNAVLLKTDDATIKIVTGNGINITWADLAGATVTATGILKHGDQETVVLRSAEDIVKATNTNAEIIASIAGTTSSSKASLLWETAAFLAFASAGFGAWAWYSRPKAHVQKLTLQHNTV